MGGKDPVRLIGSLGFNPFARHPHSRFDRPDRIENEWDLGFEIFEFWVSYFHILKINDKIRTVKGIKGIFQIGQRESRLLNSVVVHWQGGALIAGKRRLVRIHWSLSLIQHEESGAELYARLERPHPLDPISQIVFIIQSLLPVYFIIFHNILNRFIPLFWMARCLACALARTGNTWFLFILLFNYAFIYGWSDAIQLYFLLFPWHCALVPGIAITRSSDTSITDRYGDHGSRVGEERSIQTELK